jgi:hypothetical protein
MAQRAHTAQMVLKLIINKTNTSQVSSVSLCPDFFYTEEPEMSCFSFQKSGHPRQTILAKCDLYFLKVRGLSD